MTAETLPAHEPVRNYVLMALIALLLVAAACFAYTVKLRIVPLSPAEQAIVTLRATPLIGLAIKDNAAAEKSLREAIADDEAEPVAPGVPSRLYYAVGAVSRDYIRPMLAAADDASIDAVMAARFALATQLRADDPQACRDFAMNGVQRVDRLTPEAQKLFNAYLSRMEAAYRSGKAAGGKPQPILTPPEIVQMLTTVGFDQDDFDGLNRFATLASLRACDINLKIDGAPPRLPADKRAPFGRFVLTH